MPRLFCVKADSAGKISRVHGQHCLVASDGSLYVHLPTPAWQLAVNIAETACHLSNILVHTQL